MNQFYAIPNDLIIKNTDSDIFTFIVLNLIAKYNKCQISQNKMVDLYGKDQSFYSKSINKLHPKFITKTSSYSKGGQKEDNIYFIKKPLNFTMIYVKIINKIINKEIKNKDKILAFYIKLRRWINNDELIAKNLTKKQIAEYNYCSKNTSNLYLKELEKLELIKIEKDKNLNTFIITLIEEINIKNESESENKNKSTNNFEIKTENLKNNDLKMSIKILKNLPYDEYLQTEYWKKLRLKILKRALYKCELCYSNNKLNVHHKTYERKGEELLTDLICLCERCHNKFHDIIN